MILNIFLFSFSKFAAKTLTCVCNICPDDVEQCETRPGGSCFSSVRGTLNSTTNEYDVEYEYGCMAPEQSGGLLQVDYIMIKFLIFFQILKL